MQPVALAPDVAALELAEPALADALRALRAILARHPHGSPVVPMPWQLSTIGRLTRWPAYRAELTSGTIVCRAVPRQACHRPGRDGCCRVCRGWPPVWTFTVG